MHRFLVCAALPCLAAAAQAHAQAHAQDQEDTRAFQLLDNGDFAEPAPTSRDSRGILRLPWWKTAPAAVRDPAGRGAEQVVEREGRPALRTGPGQYAFQPVAAYAPLTGGLVVRGQVSGRGVVTLQDGLDARVSLSVGGDGEEFVPFEWTAAEMKAELGRELVPRLLLHLAAQGNGTALWRDLEVQVLLPLPTPDDLRAEIVAELDWIFTLWRERARDDTGQPTAFLAHYFDVLTGEPTLDAPGGPNVYAHLLLAAADLGGIPAWAEARDRLLEDILDLCLNEDTGLPRTWNSQSDQPNDDQFVEVAGHIGFLLDVAERGPERLRERARAAAERAGATVLAKGLFPDGDVCAKYRPSDGQTNTGYIDLRVLDVPAQLARLGALTGEEAYVSAALEAIARLEYAHSWPGTWAWIDPGFDDRFGHYGARSLVMWRAQPDQPAFRRLALEGYHYYAPLWRDALRLGGNVAADQVRCWGILAELAELEPALREEVAPLLRAAVRSHFKGQQYPDGVWGDVTVTGFDPKSGLQVGDTQGVPQNLLLGLAIASDPALAATPGGPDLDELRAMFTAVLRSSRETYRRPFGYLSTRREVAGINQSIGSFRLAVGLVAMLEKL